LIIVELKKVAIGTGDERIATQRRCHERLLPVSKNKNGKVLNEKSPQIRDLQAFYER